MAVNLASKYAKELAQAFSQKSYVDGIACKDYEFTGVKNLKVYTAVSQELNDYKRSGTNRYGEPKEAQDTVQNAFVKITKYINKIDFSESEEKIKAYTQEGLQLLDVGKLDSLEKAEEFIRG